MAYSVPLIAHRVHVRQCDVTTGNIIYINLTLVLYSNHSHDLITLVYLYTLDSRIKGTTLHKRIALEHDNGISYTLVTSARPSACVVYKN